MVYKRQDPAYRAFTSRDHIHVASSPIAVEHPVHLHPLLGRSVVLPEIGEMGAIDKHRGRSEGQRRGRSRLPSRLRPFRLGACRLNLREMACSSVGGFRGCLAQGRMTSLSRRFLEQVVGRDFSAFSRLFLTSDSVDRGILRGKFDLGALCLVS